MSFYETRATGSRAGSGSAVNAIPTVIQEKVDKIQQMVKKSQYGQLQGDIEVTKNIDGNYNVSYTQVKEYGTLKSATIGVSDIPARKETTHTTYILDNNGKRIDTIRKTETEYQESQKAANKANSDWTGANANRGISRKEKRRLKEAAQWAALHTKR